MFGFIDAIDGFKSKFSDMKNKGVRSVSFSADDGRYVYKVGKDDDAEGYDLMAFERDGDKYIPGSVISNIEFDTDERLADAILTKTDINTLFANWHDGFDDKMTKAIDIECSDKQVFSMSAYDKLKMLDDKQPMFTEDQAKGLRKLMMEREREEKAQASRDAIATEMATYSNICY